MIEINTFVEVIYPDYAKGYRGIIKAKETDKRWLVEINRDSYDVENMILLLSLEESDFKVIKSKEFQ